jgi:hypothetical protein
MEQLVQQMLAIRGVETVPQKAIGPYNADLGAEPVAVECFSGEWHRYGRHIDRFPERSIYLLDQGWNLAIIWIENGRRNHAGVPLTGRAIDYLVTFIEQSRRDPTFRREYRVIWGDGKILSVSDADLDNFSVIPTRGGAEYLRT